MSKSQDQRTCSQWCWVLGFAIGAVTGLLLMIMAAASIVTGLFAGIVIGIIAGFLLNALICSGLSSDSGVVAGTAVAGTGAVAASAASAGEQAAESASSDAVSAAASDASADVSEAVEAAEESASDAVEAAGDAGEAAGDMVKFGTTLSGEEELAGRKGEWRYEGGDASDDADGGPVMSEEVAADVAAGEKVDLTDYDGDGVSEGAGEGTRPEALAAARDGKADDLKQIKGVGPKLEKLLNSMGFWHFDQVAGWTASEVAWVDANLTGFKGRVSRDNWVEQAKILAAGGETEFSKKVEKGGVY